VLVNTSSPQGSTGITTNVFPSMTLGCGAIAGNVTSDNVGPMHLINIKRIAFHVRDAQSAFQSEEAKAYFAGQSLPASAAPAARETAMPKIAEAVGRYLAQRGIAGPASAAPAASTAASFAPATRSAALSNPAASVVDRFLARRGGGNPGASSGFASNPSFASPPPASPAASLAPPAPQVQVVPFVAEDDVRRARFKQQKIYINAKTIVTPAARDLDDGTILVRTE
jgi:acetaldehyde dehydrogenase (acetylating)